MNKRLKKLSIILMLIFTLIPLNVYANSDVKLWIDGSVVTTDVAPVIENGRTLVPLRVVSENLGYLVEWDEETREVTITKPKEGYTDVFTVIYFTIGDSNLHTFDMKVIGEDVTGTYFEVLTEVQTKKLDVAPKIVNDRTLVPIRAIAENFGRNVSWDNSNRTVVIGDGYTAPVVKTSNTFSEAKVTRVVDGDTIEIDLQGQKYKVRLILVDTPETKHPNKGVEYFGKEASDFTTSQLSGKTVYLQKDVSETDKYGRLLRYVWIERPASDNPTADEVESKCFNAMLLAGGYAKIATFPPDVKYVDLFRSLESQARQSNMGLWSGQDSKPSAPVVKNNSTKKKEFQEYSQPIVSSYVGNSNSHKFHKSSCGSASKTAPHNRVAFSSRNEAINAGYVPCKRCNP